MLNLIRIRAISSFVTWHCLESGPNSLDNSNSKLKFLGWVEVFNDTWVVGIIETTVIH